MADQRRIELAEEIMQDAWLGYVQGVESANLAAEFGRFASPTEYSIHDADAEAFFQTTIFRANRARGVFPGIDYFDGAVTIQVPDGTLDI